ncbi:MAG TPA: helix-turn-helix transcriptional regulator [Alphaproteobacteria bacterium]|nr:helix-turn-helix transcriptional regulator [Alphaproteobacteria bacterium]HRJ67615.1 helix-turn-helix transcriptional regulator [Alphaproteobacteria bacterium]
MDISKKLGARIQKLRQDKGLSQEDLAFESDLHRTYISHVERGSRNITVIGLCKIAKGLGIKPSDVLEGIRL